MPACGFAHARIVQEEYNQRRRTEAAQKQPYCQRVYRLNEVRAFEIKKTDGEYSCVKSTSDGIARYRENDLKSRQSKAEARSPRSTKNIVPVFVGGMYNDGQQQQQQNVCTHSSRFTTGTYIIILVRYEQRQQTTASMLSDTPILVRVIPVLLYVYELLWY